MVNDTAFGQTRLSKVLSTRRGISIPTSCSTPRLWRFLVLTNTKARRLRNLEKLLPGDQQKLAIKKQIESCIVSESIILCENKANLTLMMMITHHRVRPSY